MADPKQNQQEPPDRGWRAEDDEDNEDREDELASEDDELVEEALDALTDMEAREERRDQYYRTGGDDFSPGIDTDVDANAPKQLDKD